MNSQKLNSRLLPRHEFRLVLIVIDCGPQMNTSFDASKSTPFFQAMQCAIQMFEDTLYQDATATNFFGVTMYVTDKCVNEDCFTGELPVAHQMASSTGAYIFHELGKVSPEKVAALEEFSSAYEEDCNKISNGSSTFFFSEVLGRVYTQLQPLIQLPEWVAGKCQVLLFTANNDPSNNDQIEFARCMKRAQDFRAVGVTCDTFFFQSNVQPSSLEFCTPFFWKEFLHGCNGTNAIKKHLHMCTEDALTICMEMQRRSRKPRLLARVQMYLGPSFEAYTCPVEVFDTLTNTPRAVRKWIETKTRTPLSVKVERRHPETHEEIPEKELHTVIECGGIQLDIDKHSAQKFFSTNSGSDNVVGIFLLSFVDASESGVLKFQHRSGCCTSKFLRPSEEFNGSTTVFASLLRCMIRSGTVAIAQILLAKNHQSRLYVLTPSTNFSIPNEDGTVQQLFSDGLWALPLPYSNEICSSTSDRHVPCNPELVDSACSVVRKTSIHFPYHSVQDPNYNLFRAAMHLVARSELGFIEDDSTDQAHCDLELNDSTIPDYGGMQKNRKTLEDFHNACFPPDYDPVFLISSRKQEPSSCEKRMRCEQLDPSDIFCAYANDNLEHLTLHDLRYFLKTKFVSATSKKKDLVERVKQVIRLENNKSDK